MTVNVDAKTVCERLEPLLEDADCRRGIANLAGDPFFLAFFLASVSQGEGLGAAAVGMIGQEELAGLIRGLEQHAEEERGHKEQTIEAARELFPEYFDAERYRYDAVLEGQPYYVAVLQANRARLKELGRYSRLNLYLTTTLGYEIMVVLLYATVAKAIACSGLSDPVRTRLVSLIDAILAEEEGHLGVIGQHRALLEAGRTGLSAEAVSMLEALEQLGEEDYGFAADLAVRQVVGMMSAYADPDARRLAIEAAAGAAN